MTPNDGGASETLKKGGFRDECGVFGIYGHDDAARLAYLGLYQLQHRGQESCGIVASDGLLRSERAMGLVSEVFDEERLNRLPGTSAIGHTRYSTAGEVSVREAQPFLVNAGPHGQVAVCHNGNLPFATEARKRL